MSISYTETGRVKQKARTRAALVDAARELLAAGTSPTVEQVADSAQISRATAYRYFPNQRELLTATFPEIAEASLLPDPAPEDPVERLDAVVETITNRIVEHEAELRAQLRLSLEPESGGRELPYRTGRAIGWLEDALEPLRDRMPAPARRRLAHAIRCAVGIEALVWLTDVAGLDRDDAVATMRWSASSLLRAALAELRA